MKNIVFQKIYEITTQFFKKLINMGLKFLITFYSFKFENKWKKLFAYIMIHIMKINNVFKMWTKIYMNNVFNIYQRPLWKANTYAQFILNSYATTS